MNNIAVAGAGAFGTALAIALAQEGNETTLWARDKSHADIMQTARENPRRLQGERFPENLSATSNPDAFKAADTTLLALPTQSLRGFITSHVDQLKGRTCVLCCKGIEKGSGLLPSNVASELLPGSEIAVLTGPGFAAEVAQGLPTALTLASTGPHAQALQEILSTGSLRLYLSNDPVGAQLGGALKNVVAIACGITIGAGLGESARAALMTRGYAEMMRLAVDMGANPATLSGLSGFGDLALTCTSMQSRNFSLGYDLGRGGEMESGKTFEGVATARATVTLAQQRGVEMPIAGIVTNVLERNLTIGEAVEAILSRPLKSE